MTKIAVYGSLRKGFGNHRLIDHCELLSTEVVKIPYKMVSLFGFPGLLPDNKENNITIEVYEVDDETYRRVERLESYPTFYDKRIINTTLGEMEVYVLADPSRYQNAPLVESGDWTAYNIEEIKFYD
jgi:gamma-glutamylcyclotransferase (GGCT)/AIG2-like uncharacterized protein YtfP